MAGKGGGAWKVAYADFVTAMMAFFLVMWIVAQNKPVKEAVAGYFNDPYGTSNKPGKAKAAAPIAGGGPLANQKGGTKLAPAVRPLDVPSRTSDEQPRSRNASKPTLPSLHDGNRSAVGTLVPFVEESAELDEQGKRVLDKLAPELLGKMSKIEIRGHASGRPLPPGSRYQDAWELSYARSLSTMKYLAEKGIAPKRVRLSQSGAFEPNPSAQDLGLAAQAARVEIYELNEIANDPTSLRPNRPKKPDLKRPRNAQAPPTSSVN